MPNIILCLMGPTASGKTDIACEWVSQQPCEIISIDSGMIYRGMDIGTAKPSQAILERAPHHLIDICSPKERYSAARCCDDVWALIDAIQGRGKIPLLVGGTMMYFHAIQQGLSSLPEADETIRAELVTQYEHHGAQYMHDWLCRVDPITASRMHLNDKQRVQRALEVFLMTQTPLSVHLAQAKRLPNATFVNVALFPSNRAWLHERIARRFDEMLLGGFIDEVRGLVSQWGLTEDEPSMRSVGYRQVFAYLQGQSDRGMLREQGVAATRQLAKRQLTWLRRWSDVAYYDPEDPTCMKRILAHVKQIMDNQL